MFTRTIGLCLAALVAAGLIAASPVPAQPQLAKEAAIQDGVVKVKSLYPMTETIERIKRDVAAKGITFFSEIDQAKLAAGAGISLRPSTLLIFGNPGLGSHFITANPAAGLDWPVRLLVTQDANGGVWAVYTDFAYIARRHGIANRDAQFQHGVAGDRLDRFEPGGQVALNFPRHFRGGPRGPTSNLAL